MKQGYGKIVNILLVCGFCGYFDGYIVYVVFKVVIDNLMKQLVIEWLIKGVKEGFVININVIVLILIKLLLI